jgi:hypothetical protein
MAAYRLAKHYNQHPDTFLNKTPTEIRHYLHWTNEVVKQDHDIQAAEEAWNASS